METAEVMEEVVSQEEQEVQQEQMGEIVEIPGVKKPGFLGRNKTAVVSTATGLFTGAAGFLIGRWTKQRELDKQFAKIKQQYENMVANEQRTITDLTRDVKALSSEKTMTFNETIQAIVAVLNQYEDMPQAEFERWEKLLTEVSAKAQILGTSVAK